MDSVFHRETDEPRPNGGILKGGQVLVEWPAHFVPLRELHEQPLGGRNSAKTGHMVIWRQSPLPEHPRRATTRSCP